MALEDFKILSEICSLDSMIQKHMVNIESERLRITQLSNARNVKQSEIESEQKLIKENRQKLSALENQLAHDEQVLSRARENLSNATTEREATGLQHEVDIFAPKISQLEDKILELIEQMEKSESLIKTNLGFLTGSEKTLGEIQKEVDSVVAKEQSEIDINNDRISNLESLLPAGFSQPFSYARNKYRFNHPICFLEGTSCERCRFFVDRQTCMSIDKGEGIFTCGGCGRVLISKYCR